MKSADVREGISKAIIEAAKKDNRIFALEGDTGKGTLSNRFADLYPDRFVEIGISEQNMMSVAAGLALEGLIPFTHCFAIFAAGRVWDQTRQCAAAMNLNVKIYGVGAGLSDFNDGSSHQMLEDVALMRAIPNMCVLVPCDYYEAIWAVQAALDYDGPVYIRGSRNDIPVINNEEKPYDLMKVNLRKSGEDAVVYSNGVMVARAIEAAEKLDKEGISTAVVNIPCVKPLDAEGVLRYAQGKKAICVAEEHSRIGGLGSAVCDALRKEHHAPIEMVSTNDCFAETAQGYDALLEAYNLTSEAIYNAVLSNVK